MPLDKLQVDRGILQRAEFNQRSANILTAAITPAKTLELRPCVKGVETEQSLQKIMEMGADEV